VNWGRRWYLVAFDTGRGDWRTFRVDPITPRTSGGARFTPRPLPAADPEALAGWVARRVATGAWRYRARVTVIPIVDPEGEVVLLGSGGRAPSVPSSLLCSSASTAARARTA
jgi:hypothetical protein